MKDILLKSINPQRIILFAAGGGGNPERHLPLLQDLADNDSFVIAPHFEHITSPFPTSEELLFRASRLKSSLETVDSDLPVIGVGHSIGAALLLGLAGAKMYQRAGESLSIEPEPRLRKLVLLTPPTGFFQAPGALDPVQISVQLWAGSMDTMTDVTHVSFLKSALKTTRVDFHVVEGAGHFSFMNTLPPNRSDSMPNRDEFLKQLAKDICRFISE